MRWQMHQLRWHARDTRPRILPEQREPDLREDARIDHATLYLDEAKRTAELVARCVHTEHPQRDVRLDRRAQVSRAVVVQGPRPVLPLRTKDVRDRPAGDVIV